MLFEFVIALSLNNDVALGFSDVFGAIILIMLSAISRVTGFTKRSTKTFGFVPE